MSTSARARRYGKAPPILPGIETGADMARAAFRLGRARRRAKQSAPQAPQTPTFETFEQDAQRRGRY